MATPSYKINGFRLSRNNGGLYVPHLGPFRKIKAGIARAAVAYPDSSMFWKLLSDGTVDVVAAADTTTAGANILGLGVSMSPFSSGNDPDYKYLANGATVGFVQCIEDRNAVYEGTEDGVGGPISTSGVYTGSVGLIAGAAITAPLGGFSSSDPVSTDLLDSSTASTTTTTNAFILMGFTPMPLNQGGTDSIWTWQFRIGATFQSTVLA